MIIHSDILAWAASYDGPKFHALLCDPPYHLTETTKRFGNANAAPAQYGSDGMFQRAARGFMGRSWDGGAIAFQAETWAALAQHLYPGAFLFAFAGTRGYHRMTCAIEDAGFIIHPAIGWSFGSGFPKATRIDTQIDRRAGAERVTIGKHPNPGSVKPRIAMGDGWQPSPDITAPVTALAQAWQGHRYGGQVLKPAFEFICVAQWPHTGRAIDGIVEHGAGALWIDGARIGSDAVRPNGVAKQGTIAYDNYAGLSEPSEWRAGRWPANLVLTHSLDCNGHCVPGCAVAALGEQSGERTAGGDKSGLEPSPLTSGIYNERNPVPFVGHNDAGTAARFFFNGDYMYERLEDTNPLIYTAKALQAEREAGLDPRQLALLGLDERNESTINDGRKTPIDNAYQRGETTRRNIHPTIKPIALARHLATLLLPPAEYAPRRLLIPFAGAGSEMIGAMLAGWEEVIGVELESDHVAIAEARLAYWRQRMYEYGDPAREIRATLADAPDGQIDMFDTLGDA